ncbi:MAG TPA: CD225/dispanin family protein [Candidatus Polarisedimenticolia bacterium]
MAELYCARCGAANDDNAFKCVGCGQKLFHPPDQSGPGVVNIASYLVLSIIVTVLCCMPLGIPAIIYAARVDPKIAGGDIDGAKESSRKAMIWIWIAFVVGLIVLIAYVVFLFLAASMPNLGGLLGE